MNINGDNIAADMIVGMNDLDSYTEAVTQDGTIDMERILISKLPACPQRYVCADGSEYDSFGVCPEDSYTVCKGGIRANIASGEEPPNYVANDCVKQGMEFDLGTYDWDFTWDGTNECIGSDNSWSYYYVRAGVGRSPQVT